MRRQCASVFPCLNVPSQDRVESMPLPMWTVGARGGLAEWGIVPPHHHPVTSSNTNTHKHIQIQIHVVIQILVEWGIIPPQQHPMTYSNIELVDLFHSLTRHLPLEQLEWEEQWNVPSGFPVALKGETAHCNQFELASFPLTPPCSFKVLLIWYQLASRCSRR